MQCTGSRRLENIASFNARLGSGIHQKLKGAAMAEPPTFWEDIFPLFTDGDVACMRARPTPVLLASLAWWRVDANYDKAIARLKNGSMPLGGPRWSEDNIKKLEAWKGAGFPEGHRPTGQ
jgi:hypothetical protein